MPYFKTMQKVRISHPLNFRVRPVHTGRHLIYQIVNELEISDQSLTIKGLVMGKV